MNKSSKYKKIKNDLRNTIKDDLNYKMNILNNQENKYLKKIKDFDKKIKNLKNNKIKKNNNFEIILPQKKKFLENSNKIFYNKKKYIEDIINRKELLNTDSIKEKNIPLSPIKNSNLSREKEIEKKTTVAETNKIKKINPKIESYYNSKALREGKVIANINNEMVIFELNENEFDIDFQIN